MDVVAKSKGTKRDRFNSHESDESDTKKMKPPMTIGDAMAIFSELASEGRVMTKSDWDILKAEGLLPPDTKKTEQDSAIIALAELIKSGAIEPALFMKSIEQFKNMRSKKKGGHKQRGGKDCDNTDYAILTAMMAVLYWTGGVGTALSYVVGSAASYLPTVDKIVETMTLCSSYLSALIPAAFPAEELSYAVGTVAHTFIRKAGETMIILAEAANLSLKLGVNVGAKTIWDTTINWVKDNPTYVLAGYAGKKALEWRKDSVALKAITGAPTQLTPEQLINYKDVLVNIVYRSLELLCDLTATLRTGATSAASAATAFASTASSSASGSMDSEGDDASIEGLKEDLDLLKGLVDAAVAAQPLPVAEGGQRSTRKRAGRKSRKSKTRNAKKRKSSGRKPKKASRKIKSRKGRKTRRRGSKKR